MDETGKSAEIKMLETKHQVLNDFIYRKYLGQTAFTKNTLAFVEAGRNRE